MQDSKEKQCLIFVRNNANDTADRIEAYAKKSGMEVVETVFNTDKKAVERLRYYIERDVIICVQPIRIQSSAVPTEFPRISWKKWC